jgi:hypothetical protein
VENSRGKKGKKASWHLTLGLKDAIFAGIGVVGLIMISFALGVLSGRGDIYRVAYSWGLLAPDGSKIAQQWSPPGVAPMAMPQGAPTAPGAAPAAATPPNPASAPAPLAAAAKQPGAAPVTGSIAAVPASSTSAKKKSKSGSSSRDHKAREEEMHRLRQEVAGKLKFQNSFDTAPKPSKLSSKQKSKEKEAKAKTAGAPTQVRVAQYRDAESAKAKVAELQKKGIKATLKQGKDQKGTFYTVYRQSAANSPTSEKLAQKPEKSSDSKRKPDSQ